MPNLISVTSRGTPQDLVKGYGLVRGLQESVPEPVRRFAGDAIGAIRDYRTVLNANPVAYIANDLVFPEPLAHGTLDAHNYRGDLGGLKMYGPYK